MLNKASAGSFAPTSAGLLAPLAQWLNDPEVSEILINRPREAFIEKQGQLIQQEIAAYDERRLLMLFQLIANENQQELTSQKPLLSGSLLDGSRVQCVLPPTALYPTLSIRRQVVKNFTLTDYQATNFYQNAQAFDCEAKAFSQLPTVDKNLIQLYQQKNWDAFIRAAIQAKKNMVISGGTSSGKTTFLNACLQEIPLNDRVIVLEDTREITLPHVNQVNLLASKNAQGIAQVSMQDLVQCCLRLRPDRIIMGEIRGREILDFISACSTGHEGSLTTIHANNPRIAFMRMTQMYKLNNVPSMQDADILRELTEVIDVIIQVGKTPQGRQLQSIYYKYGQLAC